MNNWQPIIHKFNAWISAYLVSGASVSTLLVRLLGGGGAIDRAERNVSSVIRNLAQTWEEKYIPRTLKPFFFSQEKVTSPPQTRLEFKWCMGCARGKRILHARMDNEWKTYGNKLQGYQARALSKLLRQARYLSFSTYFGCLSCSPNIFIFIRILVV